MTGTSVTIYGVELNWVLDFNKVNRSIISIPKWIDGSIDIDTNVYIRKLTGLEYVFRATDSEKYFWEILMLSHQKYELIDSVHCLLGDVWILSIESEWTGNENNSNPWTLTMEILSSGIFTIPVGCTGTGDGPSINYCEDLTTYTAVGYSLYFTILPCSVDVMTYENASLYLYKDYGVNYFGDFHHAFTFICTSLASNSRFILWMVSEDIGDYRALLVANKTAVCVEYVWLGTSPDHRIVLREAYGGVEYSTALTPWSLTNYYFNVVKSGTALTVYIYSDEARTLLITTISLTLQADHKFRYHYAVSSDNHGVNRGTRAITTNIDTEWSGTICTCP